jgi:kynurenine formamidase
VHAALLAAGVLVLENLDLSIAPAGRGTLVCLPLKIPVLEASPVRAVLLV